MIGDCEKNGPDDYLNHHDPDDLRRHCEAGERPKEPTGVPASPTAPRVEVPPYVPFPEDTIPECVQEYAGELAKKKDIDMAYAAWPLFSVLGGAIGTSRCILLKQGYELFGTIWALMIGTSGSGKGHGLRQIDKAVAILHRRLNGDPLAVLDRGSTRFRCNDVTYPAMMELLNANPRGMWMSVEELDTWFGNIFRFGKGGADDRGRWLSFHDSAWASSSRKTDERLVTDVPQPFVCIAGTIQPELIKKHMTPENISSGLLPRLRLVYPPYRQRVWKKDGFNPDLDVKLADILGELFALTPIDDPHRGPVPVPCPLSAAAEQEFEQFFNDLNQQAGVSGDAQRATLAKMEQLAPRVALIRHVCRHKKVAKPLPISREDMLAGIKLTQWFIHEWDRVQAALLQTSDDRSEDSMIGQIRTRHGGRVTVSKFQTFCRVDLRKPAARAREFLDSLVRKGTGRWVSEIRGNHREAEIFVLNDPDPCCSVPWANEENHQKPGDFGDRTAEQQNSRGDESGEKSTNPYRDLDDLIDGQTDAE